MRRPVREPLVALALFVALASSPARADHPTQPAAAPGSPGAGAPAPVPSLADSLTGDARAEYDMGALAFGDGDYKGAVLKFERAYALSKDARLLWNVAVCEKNLRHYGRVVTLLHRYQREARALMTEQDRIEAAELEAAASSFVSPVELAVSPEGAEIAIDDQVVGKAPLSEPLLVDIGERRLHVSKPGYVDHFQSLQLAGRTLLKVSVALQPEVHEGRINVVTDTGASIFVDGRPVGTARWTGPLAAGGHTLRIQAPGKRSYQGEVIVREKETRDVHIALDPEVSASSTPKWLWIAAGAVVLTGAAVGGYLLFKPSNEPAPISEGSMTPGSVRMPLVGGH